ncbi:hypothetical protein EYF80_007869 [Liparis tanakae]|uniref:Uncharacterized protein n=1 Tax=Liparis tanakae TaxID=230148 RepID=A0A4Z2IVU9_9TELE|nr:hypothetical protein EYF80_007869 [Liparis tanakae]
MINKRQSILKLSEPPAELKRTDREGRGTKSLNDIETINKLSNEIGSGWPLRADGLTQLTGNAVLLSTKVSAERVLSSEAG